MCITLWASWKEGRASLFKIYLAALTFSGYDLENKVKVFSTIRLRIQWIFFSRYVLINSFTHCFMVLPVTLYITRVTFLQFVQTLAELSDKAEDTSQDSIEGSSSLTETSAPCTSTHSTLEVYTIVNNIGTWSIIYMYFACPMSEDDTGLNLS